jgi:hypothetical protein
VRFLSEPPLPINPGGRECVLEAHDEAAMFSWKYALESAIQAEPPKRPASPRRGSEGESLCSRNTSHSVYTARSASGSMDVLMVSPSSILMCSLVIVTRWDLSPPDPAAPARVGIYKSKLVYRGESALRL